MILKTTDLTLQEIRFPAIENQDAGASFYCISLHTNQQHLKGRSFIQVTDTSQTASYLAAIHALKQFIKDKKFSALVNDMGNFWQHMMIESQFLQTNAEIARLMTAAMMNAIWDLWAHKQRKPLWRLIIDMSPEELVHCIDFSRISDAVTAEEALAILRQNAPTTAKRILELLTVGYPACSQPMEMYDCSNPIFAKQVMQANAIEQGTVHSCRGINEILAILFMAAKYHFPVSLQAGNTGMPEYAQHLAIVDYIYISCSLKNRMLEYREQQHHHFVNPAVIYDGHYQVPTLPGYSIQIKEETLQDYSFPTGRIWQRHEDKTIRENRPRTD